MDEIRRNLADQTPGGDVVVVSHPSANTSRGEKFRSGNKRLRVGTMFSGIGAPETAWRDLGWDFRWCAEIEPFPSAVLAHRFPDVRNLGDVTKVDWDAVEPVDLLCFGSPCQSFSVAGKRLGLDDARGNLALYALGVARRLRPRWLVFENVPGLLSSDGTGDFGAFLGLLGECGYGFAYRVLDAQHFGVPQRRRRVFVVGCLGDWTRAAAVLFERESLSGNPAPRREAGERVAPTISARPTGGGGLGTDFDLDGGLIAAAVTSKWAKGSGGPAGDECQNLIAHSLRAQMAVRRLTPTECERLQGFPDDFSLVPYRGKTAADGPRYKALGNSMAVPVVRWLGERIAQADRTGVRNEQ